MDNRILDMVSSPADLKLLTNEELSILAQEVREEIVTTASQTGGHVASSLGAVEIILALHSMLDCPHDKIVFDVGHQAYAHKLITGRLDDFGTLRTYGGLSGFRTSSAFILVGHVLFTLPFMVRSVLAVLSVIDLKTLEEGAASLGAGFRQRFFDIVLPNCRNGILAGSLMVVTLSMGEFNMTWLLHTPLTKTLPVGLADAYASLRLEIGSAYTLMFFLMITPLLLGLQWLARPRRRAFAPSEEE